MKDVMITSASSFDGYEIKEYIDFLSHQIVFSSNFVQELAANIADSVGGEGRALSDKLEEATDTAMKEFSEIAKERGANAVINIKINYTNLSGSVASVFISGTAVKIEKRAESIRRNVNVLSVSNYLNKKIVRPFEVALHTDGQQVFMSMKLHNYEMTKITAVKVDVTFTDIYGETTVLENVDYVMNQDINILIKTDMVPVDMDVRKIGLQSDVKVSVRKYVKDRSVCTVTEQPVDSSLSSEELAIFKKNKGADAVDKYRKTDTYWRCICGAINLPGDTQCSMCNREEKDFSNGYNFDYEEMLRTMEDNAVSAEEIKDILMKYIPSIDSGSRVELLEILQSAINMEKTRGKGAMKYSVMEKLKRKFELS
ncbi:MAG: heavy metal-binding domain-containing protein [Lachnospiraceae bacterium]|nr:heavy metal-binding domain-containing protein [Lachnospiraceae bacterium]